MVYYFYPRAEVARIQAYDGTNWVNLRVQSTDYHNLRVSLYDNGSLIESIDGNTDGKAATKVCLATGAYLFGFNGSNWDRIRTHALTNDYTFTATGTSSVFDTVTGFDKWTWVIIADNTGFTVKLQGSIDNTYWFDLDEVVGATETQIMRHVVNKPVRYVRAECTDMGSATSITIKIWGMR